MDLKEPLKFIFSIVVCQIIGYLGTFFTVPAISTWYATLNKPAFTPPNWLFMPAWTILFVLMGISLYLILKGDVNNKKIRWAIPVFSIQLVLNFLWSVIFFGLKSPIFAFIELIFLWISILLTIIVFYRINKTSAYLLIPYILWVTFAGVLNIAIWVLN